MSGKWINRLIFIHVTAAIMVTSACSNMISSSKRSFAENSNNEQYDVVIVPGVPFEDGKWSQTMKLRVYWSKYLFLPVKSMQDILNLSFLTLA